MSDDRLVTAAEFLFPHLAETARIALESEGISAVVFDASQTGFSSGFMTPARLEVFEQDLDKARSILLRDGIIEE